MIGVDKMALGEKNVAYDISLFEEHKPLDVNKNNVLKLPKNNVNAKLKAKNHLMTLVFTVLTFSLSVAIVGTMVFNQVQLTEITDKTNKITKQLEESRSENTQLQMKVNEKLAPGMVEEYAKSKLLMEKTSPCQVEYFSLSTGDKVEVTQNKGKNIIDNFLTFMSIR